MAKPKRKFHLGFPQQQKNTQQNRNRYCKDVSDP